MTINFFGPDDIPQPRDKVKIEELDVNVLPDRGRVQVNINLTPFMQRPNVAIALVRDDGHIAGDMTIIETMHNKMEFTMHIRGEGDPAGEYTLKTRLYYEQGVLEPDDEAQLAFTIPDETPEN